MSTNLASQTVVAQQAQTTARSVAGLLQRKCACGTHTIAGGECDDCKKETTAGNTLRRAAAGPGFVGGAPPIVHEVLRSPGQPLDTATRAFFEPRFGHNLSRVRTDASRISPSSPSALSALSVGSANDPSEREADEVAENALRLPSSSPSSLATQLARADFSRVRIHTDAQAADSSRAVNALAYTVGNHIVFGAGRYSPTTTAGRQLLAHELTHTIQQSGSPAVVQRACDPTQPPLDTRTKPVFFPNQRSILRVFEGKATLAAGSSREAVGLVQQALVDLKYNLGTTGKNKDGVTRKYSAETKKAVGDFQIFEAVKGAKPGVVDQATIKCLDEQRSHVTVAPTQEAAGVTTEDLGVGDEEAAGRDEDIYFERGKAKLDINDEIKIGFLINHPVKPLKGCPVTLEGFVSEDELVEFGPSLATDRIKAVDAVFAKKKHDDAGAVCKAPVLPLRQHSPLPDKSFGVSAYRKRRKVEIVPAGEKSTTAPCPPDAEQFRKLSDPEKTILTTAIDLGVGWMKTAIEKLAPKNAEGDAALTAYFGGTKRRSRIKSKLQKWRKHLNSITRKKNRHGTDCNAVCGETIAFNSEGTGSSAQMTLCPKFFIDIPHHPVLSQDEKKAFVIMHEAGHGSIGTRDTAYGHRRLIEFLSQYPELVEENTDSYTLMVLCLNGFGNFCNAPKAADSPTGMSDTEKTDSRRGLGWLQTWLIWTEQDTSSMYARVNTARQTGKGIRTKEDYYADVFDLLMATFNIHRPAGDPPPTLQEQTTVAAVLDRLLRMKDAALAGLEVEKDTDIPPFSYWTIGPGRKVFLEPDYFLLTQDRERVEHLLPLIVTANLAISSDLEPVYEKYIKANVKKSRGDVPKK